MFSRKPEHVESEARAIQRYVAKMTNDGRDIVNRIVSIMENAPNPGTQLAAAQLLLERFAGKPTESRKVELKGELMTATQTTVNLRGLTNEQLALLRSTLADRLALTEGGSE